MVGGMQTNFNLVHAAHGHIFVVAESHLIFRFLQPLHALITGEHLSARAGSQQGSASVRSSEVRTF
jgi:hypothetical protein